MSGNNSVVYTIHNDLFNFWNSPQAGDATVQELIDELPCADPPTPVNNQHYFIDDGAGGISPVWDFRASPEFEGVDDAVIVAKVLANTPDANPAENVSWLHLGKVSGDIADEVYRIFTAGGVPPTSVSFFSTDWYRGRFRVRSRERIH